MDAESKTMAPAAAATSTTTAVTLAPAPVLQTPPTSEVHVYEDSKDMNYPHAIPRRHAPVEQLARQGSFRGFPALSQKMSPFKRQLSLRINELPSTVQRKTDFQITNPGKFVLDLPSFMLFLLLANKGTDMTSHSSILLSG